MPTIAKGWMDIYSSTSLARRELGFLHDIFDIGALFVDALGMRLLYLLASWLASMG